MIEKDDSLQKLQEKLKNTELVVKELTQSLTKVMSENYKMMSRSQISLGSPKGGNQDSKPRTEFRQAFKSKKESVPVRPSDMLEFERRDELNGMNGIGSAGHSKPRSR